MHIWPTQVYKKQKRVTLSYHTGHATIGNALVKTCFLICDNNIFDFQTVIVFCGSQKLHFDIENFFFLLSDCFCFCLFV